MCVRSLFLCFFSFLFVLSAIAVNEMNDPLKSQRGQSDVSTRTNKNDNATKVNDIVSKTDYKSDDNNNNKDNATKESNNLVLWQCDKCTFKNNSIDNMFECAMCQNARNPNDLNQINTLVE